MPFLSTTLRFYVIAILMCLSLVAPSSGGESRKVEKMIEASESQTGKESLLGNSGALVKRGKALYH